MGPKMDKTERGETGLNLEGTSGQWLFRAQVQSTLFGTP